jgi:hypothetical protein
VGAEATFNRAAVGSSSVAQNAGVEVICPF